MSLTPATAETLRHALATAVVVPVTPFQADGSPDWDTYAALTARLIDAGISVVTPNGNTGEFYALSQAEARQALETAAKAATGRADEVVAAARTLGLNLRRVDPDTIKTLPPGHAVVIAKIPTASVQKVRVRHPRDRDQLERG